ncbi:MAG: class I mannose-6-phosphate isomerase [Oscillospiraceae bacterium]|jgi:mannose-6-phosphate isomerase|nr:class I mannose-6-phosphate isomerase [Oscillospiraceae bacterium]
MELYPMKLLPYISATVWGGDRLVSQYHIDAQGRPNCAEAWMLSAHPGGDSVVANGPYAGQPLRALYPHLPVLVKFIDARGDLSVQVHPRDGDAVLQPGQAGKTECWYILDAEPGAKLYLGFFENVSRETFLLAIQQNTLMELVQPFEVHPGDFFYIPAGTLHAIGKGVLLAEVQQSSDTTYRVYDYGRLQNGVPRALHIAQALAVTNRVPYRQQQRLPFCCPHFSVACKNAPGTDCASEESFVSLLVLEGEGILRWPCSVGTSQMPLRKGESVFIPQGFGPFAYDGDLRLLRTQL